ncbi:MAG: dienelactone hydrolase family protein [Pseudoxanthomonas suwonensis]|nr:dienelactone hydrolase family protein [Pseudoxanthomonas suwonensis]
MSRWIELRTASGPVGAWHAAPVTPARDGLVVIQEIFGVNAHVRDVAKRFAAHGYSVLAPSMFDPVEPGVELHHDDAGMARGRDLAAALGMDAAVGIVSAAVHWLREAGHTVGAVGYCWGGSVALLANTRLGLPAVSYYGARSIPFLHENLAAPMMFHFGQDDPLIPEADVQRHRQAWPRASIHVHPGGHAFNRDCDRHHYSPDSAAAALRQTLDFFAEHL